MKLASKKFLISVFATTLVGGINFVFAQSPAQQAIDNVKSSIDDLVGAKDVNSQSDIALRIETFKKVLDYSVSEAQDLKLKLLGLDGLTDALSAWRQKMIDALNQALAYYDSEATLANSVDTTNIAGVKKLGDDFKTWRDNTYLPVAEEVNDYLLIQQEAKAISIAEKRWAKIGVDVAGLQNSSKNKTLGDDLHKMLQGADSLLNDASKLNKDASDRFLVEYVNLNSTSSTTTTDNSTSTASSSVLFVDNSTSSEASSTKSLPPSLTSIKDLVKESLMQIRGAYQIFIEMSNLVRKLLK